MIQEKLQELSEQFNIPISEMNVRGDGRVEWICEHGVGHTIYNPNYWEDVHGCDGCCSKLKKTKKK